MKTELQETAEVLRQLHEVFNNAPPEQAEELIYMIKGWELRYDRLRREHIEEKEKKPCSY